MSDAPLAPGSSPPRGLLAWWHGTPLYLRILYACIVGALLGVGLRELDGVVQQLDQSSFLRYLKPLAWADALAIPSKLVLRLLGALAAPLVLVAVVQALMQAQIPKGSG